MSRPAVLPLLALAAVLAGCPIPQALPEYSASTITPPRILADEVPFADTPVILVPANCPTTAEPAYTLRASLVDSNTLEGVEARWFVNYDYGASPWSDVQHSDVIPPNPDTTNVTRAVPAWTFRPYDHPTPRGTTPQVGPPYVEPDVVRVVELVVSNGFDPAMTLGSAGYVAGVNRAPKPTFATQVYRWVFLTTTLRPCP